MLKFSFLKKSFISPFSHSVERLRIFLIPHFERGKVKTTTKDPQQSELEPRTPRSRILSLSTWAICNSTEAGGKKTLKYGRAHGTSRAAMVWRSCSSLTVVILCFLWKAGIILLCKTIIYRPYFLRPRNYTGDYFPSLHIDQSAAEVNIVRAIMKPVFSRLRKIRGRWARSPLTFPSTREVRDESAMSLCSERCNARTGTVSLRFEERKISEPG